MQQLDAEGATLLDPAMAPRSRQPRLRRWLALWRRPLTGLLLLALLQLSFTHFWPTFHPAAESIRLYFVESVVDAGTISIDPALRRYGIPNVDSARRNGHRYMDKAPGAALLAVPPYALLKWLGIAESLSWMARWSLLTWLAVTVPSLLGTALLYRLLWQIARRRDVAVGLTAAYALGTPALLYSALFLGHQIAAVALLAAFAALRPFDKSEERRPLAVWAGALNGFAVATEFQVFVPAAGLAVFALVWLRDWRPRLGYVLGGLGPTLALMAYHTAAFGGPFKFPYEFKETFVGLVPVNGVFTFMAAPNWPAFYGQFLSPTRGLLYAAPFLALAPWGLARLARLPAHRTVRWPILWMTLGFLTFIAGYPFWLGSYYAGARFLVPILPFLVLPLATLFGDTDAAPLRRLLRGPLLGGLALAGALLQLLCVVTFPYHPDQLSAPFWQLSVPLLLRGCLAPSPLPLAPGALLVWLALLVGLGALWLLAMLRRPGQKLPLLLAALVALAVLAAQVASAPPPDDKRSQSWQKGVRALMQCDAAAPGEAPTPQF